MITSIRDLTSERTRRREAGLRQRIQERDERETQILTRIPRIAEIKQLQTEIGLDVARLFLKGQTRFGKNFDELRNWSQELRTEQLKLLKKHNVDSTELEVRYDCSSCKDSGWIETPPSADGMIIPPVKCHCLRQEEIDDLYRASGLTGPMRQQRFEAFDLSVYPAEDRTYMKRIALLCKEFADRVASRIPQDSLLLTGDVGRGKTFLSSAIANVVFGAKGSVVYFTFSEFIELVRLYKFSDENQFSQGIQRLMDADLIVMDDLGAEKVTDFVGQELFTIINHRMNRQLPMVISTNLEPTEIQDEYGPRTASRLLNGFDVLMLRGDDVRRVLRKRRLQS